MSDLTTLEKSILEQIATAGDEAALESVRVAALGKKGSISALLATLGKMSPDERKTQGAAINLAKDNVTQALSARRDVLKSAALGLSYGAFVGRLVRGARLPALAADRAADRAALIASVDHLAQLSTDLSALIRMLRRANSEGAERYRNSAASLVSDVRSHLDLASKVIARNGAEA